MNIAEVFRVKPTIAQRVASERKRLAAYEAGKLPTAAKPMITHPTLGPVPAKMDLIQIHQGMFVTTVEGLVPDFDAIPSRRFIAPESGPATTQTLEWVQHQAGMFVTSQPEWVAEKLPPADHRVVVGPDGTAVSEFRAHIVDHGITSIPLCHDGYVPDGAVGNNGTFVGRASGGSGVYPQEWSLI
ncbi:MAG: hypothetical protein WCV91_02920 [Candidatus Margulisiibacteriota bacterium]